MACGTSTASALSKAPTRSRPAPNSRSASSSSCAARMRSSSASAWASRHRPSSVKRTPRGRRSNSRAPVAFSSAEMCRDTADCVYPRPCPAAVSDPRTATSRKTSNQAKFTPHLLVMRLAHGKAAKHSLIKWLVRS
jgi:hypothetical protein